MHETNKYFHYIFDIVLDLTGAPLLRNLVVPSSSSLLQWFNGTRRENKRHQLFISFHSTPNIKPVTDENDTLICFLLLII